MNRIFITGDCHAAYSRLGFKMFPESRGLTKDDYLIICGDFGLWDESDEMEYWLKWLDSRPYTVLFVDGNHENFDLLNRFEVREWKGGHVHFIRPSVIHLMRGQVFTIAGKKFFTFGGARSHDIKDGILRLDDKALKEKMKRLDNVGACYRVEHLSWWAEEMPSEEEREEGIRNLEKHNWSVDYIITHCCASDTQAEITEDPVPDELTDYFQEIRGRTAFTRWYFGHYHVKQIRGDKETCLYKHIVELTDSDHMACGMANRFKYREHVTFHTYGKTGEEEHTGIIVHIDENGGGLHYMEQPTANIRTEEGFYFRNIPFENIRKL